MNRRCCSMGVMLIMLLKGMSYNVSATLADFNNLESYSPYYGLAATAKEFGSKQSDCVRKLSSIEEAIRHKEVWALKLMDASGMPSSGFYWGNNYWLGSRAQCLTAYSGKEPMVSFDLTPVTRGTKETVAPFPVDYFVTYSYHNSTTQLFIHYLNETKVSLGLCLPSSCTKDEVSDLLQIYFDMEKLSLQQLFKTGLTIEETKKTDDNVNLEHPATIILLVWTLSAITLCAIGTIYDMLLSRWPNESSGPQVHPSEVNESVSQKPVTTWQQILLAFSWYSNIKTIFTTQVNKGSLVPVMGLRCLLTNFVIHIHATYYMMNYFKNRTAVYMYEINFWSLFYENPSYTIDVFFMLGGFLTIYTLSKSKELHCDAYHTNWNLLKIFLRNVFRRFRRFTPVYLFVMLMAFNVTLFRERLCSFWSNERNDVQCAKFWWTNLLYINNVYPGTFDSMCMSWSWYLACDMQFFVITSFLYILSKRYFKVAVTLASAVSIGSFTVLGYAAYATSLKPYGDQFYPSAPIVYLPPWTRINCYFAGALFSCIFVQLKGNHNIKKVYVALYWVLSVSVVMYLMFGFGDKNFGSVTIVLHAALRRAAFAAASGWMLLACLTGHGGCLNTLLSAGGLRPFSQLSYAAYLSHPVLIYAIVTSPDGAWHSSGSLASVFGDGMIPITYFISIFLVLIIEMPFDKLLSIMFGEQPRFNQVSKEHIKRKQITTSSEAQVGQNTPGKS